MPGLRCNTGSPSSWNKAKYWLNRCLTEHECEQNLGNISFLPHRVLDLQATSPSGISLFISRNTPAQYACLSHCWGSSQPLRTIKSNLRSHKHDLPLQRLPQTFQDAIAVTRHIGLRYLWIDSLCIVQDDDKDWEEQAAQMGSIYQHATITLGASASISADSGLFRRRPGERDKELYKFTNNSHHKGIYIARNRIQKFHGLRRSRLMTRGWVMQERLLSPRFLHFSGYELVFECMQSATCECSHSGDIAVIRNEAQLRKETFKTSRLQTLCPAWLSHSWHCAVYNYSEMALSFDKDTLAAISGIAKKMGHYIQSKYVAGLWESNLIYDLAWHVTHPSRAMRRSVWTAPTFSWASITQPPFEQPRSRHVGVSWDLHMPDMEEGGLDMKMAVHCQVVDTSVSLSGPDPTGPIKSASIVLHGPTFLATLVQHETIAPPETMNIPPRSLSTFFSDYNLATPGRHCIEAHVNVWCLLLMSYVDLRYGSDCTVCLVLRLVDEHDDSIETFERLGLVVYTDSQGLQADTRDFLKNSPYTQDLIFRII